LQGLRDADDTAFDEEILNYGEHTQQDYYQQALQSGQLSKPQAAEMKLFQFVPVSSPTMVAMVNLIQKVISDNAQRLSTREAVEWALAVMADLCQEFQAQGIVEQFKGAPWIAEVGVLLGSGGGGVTEAHRCGYGGDTGVRETLMAAFQ